VRRSLGKKPTKQRRQSEPSHPTKAQTKVIGRTGELTQLGQMIRLSRHILIEGPVGVGKTFLVKQVLDADSRSYHRVDGDTRYTEQKLTGWFDPPLVLKKGYSAASFIDGPLVTAMRRGEILFINELNRMPEAVQNILLPAMDEHQLVLPRLGQIQAKPGFAIIATQNPKEFTATHALSEALLDRFEMIRLEYQTKEEELAILQLSAGTVPKAILARALDLVRATRRHSAIKRGASVRAAMAIVILVEGGMGFEDASLAALPSRIEMISSEEDPRAIIRELLNSPDFPTLDEKKKELSY